MNANLRVVQDKIPNEILEFARSMRKNPTEREFTWQKLRGRKLINLKFRRSNIWGVYNRFLLRWVKLAVEIDGGYHNSNEQRFLTN